MGVGAEVPGVVDHDQHAGAAEVQRLEQRTLYDLEMLEQYRAAERDLQGLRVEILGLEARIVASRRGLLAVDPNKADPEALQRELAQHEAEVAEYEEQLTWIRRRLEALASVFGIDVLSYAIVGGNPGNAFAIDPIGGTVSSPDQTAV